MPSPLRRRLAPSVPLSLSLREESGAELRLELKLAFDFNALALAEETTGLSLLAGDVWQNPSAATLSVLFWVSLLAHQPEYDGKDGLAVVRSYMDAGNAGQIMAAVMEAFIGSLPPEQQEAMRQARPTAPATAGNGSLGSSSGQSGATPSASTLTSLAR